MNHNFTLKEYSKEDIQAVTEIFNYYITHSYAAYPEELFSPEFVEQMLDSELPKFVVSDDGKVIGFAMAYKYHPAKVFDRTTKFAYFIMPEYTHKGLGKMLLQQLELACRSISIETVLVHISSLNKPSIQFHLKNGFKECGRFKKVGKKFGKDFDDVWMQKML